MTDGCWDIGGGTVVGVVLSCNIAPPLRLQPMEDAQGTLSERARQRDSEIARRSRCYCDTTDDGRRNGRYGGDQLQGRYFVPWQVTAHDTHIHRMMLVRESKLWSSVYSFMGGGGITIPIIRYCTCCPVAYSSG